MKETKGLKKAYAIVRPATGFILVGEEYGYNYMMIFKTKKEARNALHSINADPKKFEIRRVVIVAEASER